MKKVSSVPRPLIRALPALMAAVVGLSMVTVSPAAMLYGLDSDSNYQEGCFDPCDCMTMMTDTLRGTFALVPVDGDVVNAVFDVVDVAWSYLRWEELIQVAGSGTYTRGPGGHRLELDLVAGDGPERHFDSGLVPASGDFPDLDIVVAVNGFYCYDYVFTISARGPAVAPESLTWGVLKATYR